MEEGAENRVMRRSKLWHYKVRFYRNKLVQNNTKSEKPASRNGKLLLMVVVCIVLAFGVAALVQNFQHKGIPPNDCTISQIVSEPVEWENKIVKVEGTLDEISLGIIQPFNYWLSDNQNETIRIGLRWHLETNMSGKTVTVVGVVKKGYAWVNPEYPGWWTYYIEATSICQERAYIDWKILAASGLILDAQQRQGSCSPK